MGHMGIWVLICDMYMHMSQHTCIWVRMDILLFYLTLFLLVFVYKTSDNEAGRQFTNISVDI